MQSVRVLLTEIIDYAGLFPPAKLDMDTAVRNYGAYLCSKDKWMLGRMIVPVVRLDEFEKAADHLLPRDLSVEQWKLSALMPPASDADLDALYARIAEFNDRHEDPANGRSLIDAVEIRVDRSEHIDRVMNETPAGLRTFFEVPIDRDPRGLVAALSGADDEAPVCAKVRTGGVTPEVIPTCEDVVRFLVACNAAHVGFKATAGLHHPVRHHSEEVGAPMHGFFNLFLAAAGLMVDELDEDEALELLEERDEYAFRFTDCCAAWRDLSLDDEQIALTRERFALSFGSCSFTEPIDDLRRLELFPGG
ncbi:MAG: hypothetical protein H6814_05675 [Phycisphaeraceae bacterium]|nr:hypothetical protein [Phycisphaeraceae bacterium]